ncbi:MAG TPA: SDR family NAD(P)-dependent oxidoreductase [Verrucomicrobiae bacterium]
MQLTGKVALVTGGTRGIGAATALAFAKAGADVAITGRRIDEEAQRIHAAIQALGRRCELIRADHAIPADNTRTVTETESKLGAIDVLVHSAGGPINGGLLDLSPEDWQRAFDVHIHAIFHLSRAVIPKMREKREGAIVLVGSTAGIRGIITNVAYQVVKGAIPQFTRALAREFANDNIRVNCVAPGVIRTDFHATMSAEQKRLNLEQRIPLHREGTPEQVAEVILMLASNDYITGETMVIDGGLTMRIA